MAKRKPFVQFKRSKNGQHYWHIKAANGKIVADSAEQYKNRVDAENGLRVIALALQQPWRYD